MEKNITGPRKSPKYVESVTTGIATIQTRLDAIELRCKNTIGVIMNEQTMRPNVPQVVILFPLPNVILSFFQWSYSTIGNREQDVVGASLALGAPFVLL
jgi:hypothetical protein